MEDDGIFRHQCEAAGCTNFVLYDDEPKCYTHSPDSGSSVRGYSARRAHAQREQQGPADAIQ